MKKFVFTPLLLFFAALPAQAFGPYGCHISNNSNTKYLVVSFEGLAGELFNFKVYNYLDKPLKKAFGDQLEFGAFPYPGAGSAISCIEKKKKIVGKDLKVLVIGHSYGGKYGVFSTLNGIKRKNLISKDNLYAITIDPRSEVEDAKSFFRFGSITQFSNPGAGTFVNFWQQYMGLPGYKVAGAFNCQVTGHEHVLMPTNAAILYTADSLLKGNGIPKRVIASCKAYETLLNNHNQEVKNSGPNVFGSGNQGQQGQQIPQNGTPGAKESTVSGDANTHDTGNTSGKVYRACPGNRPCFDVPSKEVATCFNSPNYCTIKNFRPSDYY